jgi:hypothetical protein
MDTRNMLVGIGVGALLAYLADPQSGRRRRALARDKVVRASRKTRDALDATTRDVRNRATGAVAAARRRWMEEDVDDDRLVDRVRARLGRVATHPRALHVVAVDGVVTLRGPVLVRESAAVLSAVHDVPGVLRVVDELDGFESANGVPGLQGEGRAATDARWRGWAPATQGLVAGLGLGAAAIVAAQLRRSSRRADVTGRPAQR